MKKKKRTKNLEIMQSQIKLRFGKKASFWKALETSWFEDPGVQTECKVLLGMDVQLMSKMVLYVTASVTVKIRSVTIFQGRVLS